jgi:hypothetical protein
MLLAKSSNNHGTHPTVTSLLSYYSYCTLALNSFCPYIDVLTTGWLKVLQIRKNRNCSMADAVILIPERIMILLPHITIFQPSSDTLAFTS